jgi:hypothetical protein
MISLNVYLVKMVILEVHGRLNCDKSYLDFLDSDEYIYESSEESDSESNQILKYQYIWESLKIVLSQKEFIDDICFKFKFKSNTQDVYMIFLTEILLPLTEEITYCCIKKKKLIISQMLKYRINRL